MHLEKAIQLNEENRMGSFVKLIKRIIAQIASKLKTCTGQVAIELENTRREGVLLVVIFILTLCFTIIWS